MTVHFHDQKTGLIENKRLMTLFLMLLTACGWSSVPVLSEFDPLGVLENESSIETGLDDPNTPANAPSGIMETAAVLNASQHDIDALAPVTIGEPNIPLADKVAASTQITHSETKTPSAPTAKENSILAASTGSAFQQQLWKARISATYEDETDTSKSELDRIIEQLNAIEIKIQPQPPMSSQPEPMTAPVTAAATNTDPNDTAGDVNNPEPVKNDELLSSPPDGTIAPGTLTQLKAMSQKPEQLHNPFQMAEILYSSGCLPEAAACYQAAFDRLAGRDTNPARDKAWILFQLGNCLKDEKPQAAREKYQAVIEEFPQSPWASLAKARSDAIDWFLKEQPAKLLQGSRKKVQSN